MEQESNLRGCLSVLSGLAFLVVVLGGLSFLVDRLPNGWWPALFVVLVVALGVAGLWRQFMGEDDDPDSW